MAESPSGQNAIRAKGNIKCIHHQKILNFACETCQDLACMKCVTSLHKGHDLCNLKDIVLEAEEEINTFIENTEKSEIPIIQEAIISAKYILKKETDHFDELEKEVIKQLAKLKQDLELISAKVIPSYQQLRKENMEIITGHIKSLETRQEEITRCLDECKNVLERRSYVNIYDTRKDVRNVIQGIKPLPVKPNLGDASFIPNKQTLDHLTKWFGTVTRCHQTQEGPAGHHQVSSTDPSKSTPEYSTQKQFKYNILPNTKVITEFWSPCDIDSICTTNDGQVYTSNLSTITKLDNKGEIQRKIEYKARISDVRVSPTTQHVWACSDEDCSVMECVPPQSPVVRFKTENKPTCLCVTVDNYLLIGMSKQIVKYSTQGKILLTNKPSWLGFGKPVVRLPQRITECSVTHNVAVVDMDDGGDGKEHVVVLDKNLQKIFCYGGDIPTKYQQTIERGEQEFCPLDVRYDSVGNLVIGDHNRVCVHLLSGSGDYLKLVHTDYNLMSFGIDVNNILWVVNKRKVKLVQYYDTFERRPTESTCSIL